MPCRDDYAESYERKQLERVLNITTILACAYCHHLEAIKEPIPQWAEDWWHDHKRQDAVRIQQEKDYKEREKIKAIARTKLTAEEYRIITNSQ